MLCGVQRTLPDQFVQVVVIGASHFQLGLYNAKISKRYISAVCASRLQPFVSFAMSIAGVWVLSIQEGAVSVDGEAGRNEFRINVGVDVEKLCSFS
jgi:hypothetical protein